MVTNLVFILEAVQVQRTRLLVASLNGWPIGMMFTGFVGWISANWRIYFGCVCVTAISLAFLLVSLLKRFRILIALFSIHDHSKVSFGLTINTR
jgi:hypothetical protein